MMDAPNCRLCGEQHWSRERCKALGAPLEARTRRIEPGKTECHRGCGLRPHYGLQCHEARALLRREGIETQDVRPGATGSTGAALSAQNESSRVPGVSHATVSHATVSNETLPSADALRQRRWRKAHPEQHARKQRAHRRRRKLRQALAAV